MKYYILIYKDDNIGTEKVPVGADRRNLKRRRIDMKDMMRYKNYYGSVHYSDEDKVFYGKVEFIRALVSYEGTDVKSLRKSFEEAVEDYLQTCKKQGKEPEHPSRDRSIYGSAQACINVLC